MYRFHSITNLAPLFSVLPLGAWLMLLAGAVVGAFLQPAARPRRSSTSQ